MAGTPEIARENGKKGGRPVGSKATHTIQAEAGKAALIKAYIENIHPINQALIDKALTGDIAAIRELHDRVHGRPNQAVDVTSKGESINVTPEKLALAKEYEEKIKKGL